MIFKFPETVAAGAHFSFPNLALEKFDLSLLTTIGAGAYLDFSGNKFAPDQVTAILAKLADLNWQNGVLDLSGSPIDEAAAAQPLEKLQSGGCTILHS